MGMPVSTLEMIRTCACMCVRVCELVIAHFFAVCQCAYPLSLSLSPPLFLCHVLKHSHTRKHTHSLPHLHTLHGLYALQASFSSLLFHHHVSISISLSRLYQFISLHPHAQTHTHTHVHTLLRKCFSSTLVPLTTGHISLHIMMATEKQQNYTFFMRLMSSPSAFLSPLYLCCFNVLGILW